MDAETRKVMLDTVTELVKQAIRAAEAGHWDSALQQLDEAGVAFEAIPPVAEGASGKDPRYLGLGAAIAEGKGQIGLRSGKVEAGMVSLQAALELRLAEEAAGGAPPPMAIPVSLVNLTGAAHSLGRVDEALAFNTRAIERLRPLDAAPSRIFLAAALEARGNLLSQRADHANAMAALVESAAIAKALAAVKTPSAAQLLTEILVAHARAAGRAGEVGEAIRLCGEAAEVSWDRFEANPQGDREAISHFVAAQMNLLGFAEQAGRFGEAEDALFKVLRLVGPDVRVIGRGKTFYETLLAMDDARLEAGNLPREEVIESYQQLAQIAKAAAERARPPA